ncbi:MAG TPA: class I SAM-dependent methyltransferase [Chloroflexota bacterium]|nr:class I SAM-dependent methyltransferase [Chloroflexota bacterium]
MIADPPAQLYRYYQQSELLPTFARLQNAEQLDAYEAQRAAVFEKRLHLPRRSFAGADLLEFGPDSGENALVFARWGASLTLAEPNPHCWEQIERYFQTFELSHRLLDVDHRDIESFDAALQFDFIDAEGFIYTVRPESIWMHQFARLLRPGGLFLVSYYEAAGALFELLHRALFARFKDLARMDSLAAAHQLFQPKWDSIPHTRAFDSWVMDVLENPFVRLRYFFNAAQLCRQLAGFGFELYSSWPRYEDGLSLQWHKQADRAETTLERNEQFIQASCLSHALGRKLFIGALTQPERQRVADTLRSLIESVDGLIDRFDAPAIGDCLPKVDELIAVVRDQRVIAESENDRDAAAVALNSLANTLRLVLAGAADGLVEHCRKDAAFLGTWGAPAHLAVFQKEASQ